MRPEGGLTLLPPGVGVAFFGDDRQCIGEPARYNFAIDGGEAATWAATFTPEGVFDSTMGTFEGTAALAEFAAGFAKEMPGTEHWVSNQVIEGDGDRATHRCYVQLITAESGESLARAKYSDELVKLDGEWKFSRRVVR